VRVVVVDPRGDSRPYDEAFCAALDARGVTTELWTCRGRHADLPRPATLVIRECFYTTADRLGGPFRRVARGVEHPISMLRVLVRLRRDPPTVVHVQWLPLGWFDRVAWRAARRLVGRPIVYTAHNATPKHGVGSQRQVRADCAPFDRIVVHSRFGAASLARLGVDEQRIVRIPHGALDAYCRVAPVTPRVAADRPVVAFVGLIRPYKGLSVLLDAWPAVRDGVPDAELVVAGKPLGVDGIADRLAGMRGVTATLGYVPSGVFAGILRRADLLVLPYLSIDSSGVVFAALALGTPFVASDVGALGEVAADTGAGIVVAPGDPAALAGAITGLLGDAERRRAMRAAALAAAAGPYAFAESARAAQALYEAVSSSFAP
jgi:glycosyltransferase involved in cell wall biosynthesis